MSDAREQAVENAGTAEDLVNRAVKYLSTSPETAAKSLEMAQVTATIAIAQALVNLGDVLEKKRMFS